MNDLTLIPSIERKKEITKKILQINSKGGPNPTEYQELDYIFDELTECKRTGMVSNIEIAKIISQLGESFSTNTMQGFAYHKPHGYSGDFEIIERIYNYYICQESKMSNWDYYWQNHKAARAVRNRKQFFKNQIENIFPSLEGSILNIASGPCTELKEFFDENDDNLIQFDCLDMDPNAIAYAKQKLKYHRDKVNFICQNIFRFQATKKYNLIWSAGLFDYFDEKTFKRTLAKIKTWMKPNGVILIGNFDTNNSSKNYMDFFGWHLNHRSKDTLKKIGSEIFDTDNYRIEVLVERECVNLFLKIQS